MVAEQKTSRLNITKAFIVGGRESSHKEPESAATDLFKSLDDIEPTYDPVMLCQILDHSNSLRQNIDAYATSINGFGLGRS